LETLTGSFEGIVSQAKKGMPEKDFKRAEKRFDEIARKARAARGRRRETA